MNKVQKQTGLIFQPDMARANVAGLKTMTRRGQGLARINENPDDWRFDGWVSDTTGDKRHIGCASWSPITNGPYDVSGAIRVRCPWEVGQLIYQKERWRVGSQDRNTIWYDDGTFKVLSDTADNLAGKFLGDKNKSPLFMPKWAARFWAEIVSIKVERVRGISAEDCLKEGIVEATKDGKLLKYGLPSEPWVDWHRNPQDAYKELYNRINGDGAFDRDWCWVIEYRKVER